MWSSGDRYYLLYEELWLLGIGEAIERTRAVADYQATGPNCRLYPKDPSLLPATRQQQSQFTVVIVIRRGSQQFRIQGSSVLFVSFNCR